MKKARLAGAFLLLALILLRASQAVEGAQRAMALWVTNVAPALFPFLVLMPMLTGADASAVYRMLFSGMMQPLFRLPGQAAPAVVIGMIAGSPGGAIATAQLAGQNGMHRGEAWRIALAVVGVSPAFLIMGVGRGMYGSTALGVRLAFIQIFTQLFLLLFLRSFFKEETSPVQTDGRSTMDQPVRKAVETVLVICGYMVFFSAAGAAVAGIIGAEWGKLLLLVVDLPSGLAELAGRNFPAANFLLGAAIGFGGLCIGMQNLDALHEIGLSAGCYFAVRSMATVIMGVACMLILPHQQFSLLEKLQNPRRISAFSILIALILAIPPMVSFSRKCFLNKQEW